MLSYFLTCELPGQGQCLPEPILGALVRGVGLPAEIRRGLVFVPGEAKDRYTQDEQPPSLMMELYFDTITDLERMLAGEGLVHWLSAIFSAHHDNPALAACTMSGQAMLSRDFACPHGACLQPGQEGFGYVVAYEGPAVDLNAWLSFYIASHAPLLQKLPGVREVEISSEAMWCAPVAHGWKRETYMQRNHVLFDSAQALTDALHSPVRDELRRDGQAFPPAGGRSPHFPMRTLAMHTAAG